MRRAIDRHVHRSSDIRLAQRFGNDLLVELKVRGWPKPVFVDALWSRLYPPGPAGSWLLSKMLE